MSFLGRLRAHTRRYVGALVALTLSFSVLTFVEPAEAACDTFLSICTVVPGGGTSSGDTITAPPSTSGSCNKPYDNNPIVVCGWAGITRCYDPTTLSWCIDQARLPVRMLSPSTQAAATVPYQETIILDDGYLACMGAKKTLSNPAYAYDPNNQPKTIDYYADGVAWKDTRPWTTTTTITPEKLIYNQWVNAGETIQTYSVSLIYGLAISDPFTVTTSGYYNVYVPETQTTKAPVYTDRITDWWCTYPDTATKEVSPPCAVMVDNGQMLGPTANAVTIPTWPLDLGATVDVKTSKKTWYSVPDTSNGYSYSPNIWRPVGSTVGTLGTLKSGTMFSPLGWEYHTNPATFTTIGANSKAINLVKNCKKIDYRTTVRNQDCVASWDGKTYKAGSFECTPTQGNYLKTANGFQITCEYAILRYPVYKEVWGKCGAVESCGTTCGVSAWMHLDCNLSGADGRDTTTNFNNSCKPTITPQCVWTGKASLIDTKTSLSVALGAQFPATGRRLVATWPKVSIGTTWTLPIENKWSEFVRAENSQPERAGVPASDATQHVWGHYSATAKYGSDASMISSVATPAKILNWDNNVFYFAGFKGTTANTGGSYSLGGSLVNNPQTVNTKELQPYGIHEVYHFTSPVAGKSALTGQPYTFNQPYECKSNMFWVRFVQGRAKG